MAFTLIGPGVSQEFFAATSPLGRPLSQPVIFQEPLTVPGIDFERWRDVHLRFVPYPVTVMAAIELYSQAINLAESIESAWTQLWGITWELGGSTQAINNAKMVEPPVIELRRAYISALATPGPHTLLSATLVLQSTESRDATL